MAKGRSNPSVTFRYGGLLLSLAAHVRSLDDVIVFEGTDKTGVVQKSCFKTQLESLKYTQPPYATAFPELLSIYRDHPCTPVHNTIEGNVYCHAKSLKGGSFINVDAAQAASWLSTIANNTERC